MKVAAETLGTRRRVAQLEDEAEIAERLASYDDGGPEISCKYRFIASEQANFPLRTLCKVTKPGSTA
ncbi:MAG: hypothetical protein ACP5VR_11920 [Acidimicrobiales bacterium]